MDYPSTTQALFALIVMIMVLAFILIYCCWGTFSCHKRGVVSGCDERGEMSQLTATDSTHSLFILPYRSVIYIGDGQTRRVYQMPLNGDKPPSYRDIFSNFPSPPSYGGSAPLLDTEDQPPSYEECVRKGDELGVSGRYSSGGGAEACNSSSSHPRFLSLSSSTLLLPRLTNGMRATSKLCGSSFSDVFTARQIVMGITASSSRLAQNPPVQSHRVAPMSDSTISSKPPSVVSFTDEAEDKSPHSLTTSSTPCLPFTFQSISKSNTYSS